MTTAQMIVDRLLEDEGECTYHAFYKGKQIELKGKTALDARDKAAKQFKAKKAYDVRVVLVGLADGSQVFHHAESQESFAEDELDDLFKIPDVRGARQSAAARERDGNPHLPVGNPEDGTSTPVASMSLSELARVIRRDWKKVYFGAVPYLDAMAQLDSINGNYYEDSGRSIVAYFLSNASQWRGEVAKKVKAELNRRLKNRSESQEGQEETYEVIYKGRRIKIKAKSFEDAKAKAPDIFRSKGMSHGG